MKSNKDYTLHGQPFFFNDVKFSEVGRLPWKSLVIIIFSYFLFFFFFFLYNVDNIGGPEITSGTQKNCPFSMIILYMHRSCVRSLGKSAWADFSFETMTITSFTPL